MDREVPTYLSLMPFYDYQVPAWLLIDDISDLNEYTTLPVRKNFNIFENALF